MEDHESTAKSEVQLPMPGPPVSEERRKSEEARAREHNLKEPTHKPNDHGPRPELAVQHQPPASAVETQSADQSQPEQKHTVK